MSSEPLHWIVQIVCKDCGAVYEVTNPDPSKEIIPSRNGTRMRGVLVWVPNEGADCHNLRVVR